MKKRISLLIPTILVACLCGCLSTARFLFSDSVWLPDGRVFPRVPKFTTQSDFPSYFHENRLYFRMATNQVGNVRYEGLVFWPSGHFAYINSSNCSDIAELKRFSGFEMGFYGLAQDQLFCEWAGGSILAQSCGSVSDEQILIQRETVIYSPSVQYSVDLIPVKSFDRLNPAVPFPLPDWTRSGLGAEE